MQQLESTAAQLLLTVWRPPYIGIAAIGYLQTSLHDVYRNFTALGFPVVRLPCSSSNPLLRSYFSLYGVRHIAELPLVVTCKRACVTPIAIFTALVFPSRPSAMRQLESTAAQLLLAVWRPPYDRIIINRYLQASLHDVYRNFTALGFLAVRLPCSSSNPPCGCILTVWRPPYSRITASCHLQASLRDTYR